MARQYSPTQFFRHVPNALLGRYFQKKRKVLKEIDFDKLQKMEFKPIFQAFTALPPELQAKIEAEFQEIDTMACQGGVLALTDEAGFHRNKSFTEAISEINSFHGKVMWTFLEHPKYWTGAVRYF